MLNDDSGFNFWPSFTDLMLSLVLVVLIILYVVSKMISSGSENLDRARKSQQAIQTQIEKEIGSNYKITVISDKDDKETTKKRREAQSDICIINKLDRQTITFSDKILFDTNQAELKPEANTVLQAVGPVIKNNIDNISEIQIQGHADNRGRFSHNLKLAADRALAVFRFLHDPIGIDPTKYLMSATSFGMFKPVGREAGMGEYSKEKIDAANATDDLKAQNRRIEIVIFFKNETRN